jgi:vancomycin permeability regulator SanA
MNDPSKPHRRNWALRVFVVVFLALILGFLGWSCWVYVQIEDYAGLDQAAPSDAIAVLGAAEYDGRPSPVFRARLDHAHDLYSRGIAPLIIVLGRTGGDEYSEGAAGRDYVVSLGIPESAMNAETQSRNTAEPVGRKKLTNSSLQTAVGTTQATMAYPNNRLFPAKSSFSLIVLSRLAV